jgi:threonine/homoserine/homoserine lactone efflux protein
VLGTQHLALFIGSGLLLNLTPGQDTLYIVGRSVAQGRGAGLLSVLGIVSGSVVHTVAVAFGLSAVLAASATAFAAVRLAGSLYLGYLGLRMLLARPLGTGTTATLAPERRWAVYRALAMLFLGGVFIFNGTLWCLVLVWGAAVASRRLRERPRTGLLLTRATGAIFVGLGARLALGA